MTSFLIENPIDVVNNIKISIESNSFSTYNALVFAGLILLIDDIDGRNRSRLLKSFHDDVEITTKECQAFAKHLSVSARKYAILNFCQANKTILLRKLVEYETRLNKIYGEVGITE